MATFEERLAAIESEQASLKHGNDDLKQKIELHTIAIGGLVNKAMLEHINEKNDQIFQVLQNHDQFTNMQLAELRERVEVQLEGSITGLQTEVRQGFERQDKHMADLRGEVNTRLEGSITGLQTEMYQGFERQDKYIADLRGEVNTRFDQIILALAALVPKPD